MVVFEKEYSWISTESISKDMVNHVVSGIENHCPVLIDISPVRLLRVSQKMVESVEGSSIW